MAWEENPRICLHMQLIAILSRTEVILDDEQEVFTIRSGWSRGAFGMAKPSKGVLLCFSEGGKNNKNGFLDKKSCGKFGRFVFSS